MEAPKDEVPYLNSQVSGGAIMQACTFEIPHPLSNREHPPYIHLRLQKVQFCTI